MDGLTSAEMRALEAAAIASGAVTGAGLMARAGQEVVDAVLDEWPELRTAPGRAVVLCGPGNNGGDGFVVARLLQARGWDVTVGFHGAADRLPPDAKAAHDAWCAVGKVLPFPPDSFEPFLRGYVPGALLVDALFGIGLARPLSYDLYMAATGLAENTFAWDWRVVAIDIPSGLDADTGALLWDGPSHPGVAAKADLTVTFHAPKAGHLQGDGPEVCGKLVVADIGLPGGGA